MFSFFSDQLSKSMQHFDPMKIKAHVWLESNRMPLLASRQSSGRLKCTPACPDVKWSGWNRWAGSFPLISFIHHQTCVFVFAALRDHVHSWNALKSELLIMTGRSTSSIDDLRWTAHDPVPPNGSETGPIKARCSIRCGMLVFGKENLFLTP